jgi:hypothetical protein
LNNSNIAVGSYLSKPDVKEIQRVADDDLSRVTFEKSHCMPDNLIDK